MDEKFIYFKPNVWLDNMNHNILGTALGLVLALGGMMFVTNSVQIAVAQEGMGSQQGVIIGYGGQVFGVANVASNGHTMRVSAVTDLVPKQDMVFEAWLVDGNYAASGYPLSLGQFIKDGTLAFDENMVNSYTYTDIMVTMEPRNDADPKPAWSNAVGAYYLTVPFGK
jgi:hypothetical protein